MINEKKQEEIQRTGNSLSPQLSKEKKELRIKKEAKKILDNFASALEKVKMGKKKSKKGVGGYREENNGSECDKDFRKMIFSNAPETDEDCIIAEKKKW